jgi:hypothetical protein
MTTRGPSRRPGPDAGASLGDPTVVADEVTRLAVALPLDYRDSLSEITRLLVIDPRNQAHMDAIVHAIIVSALDHPTYETTANRWRAHVPSWVRIGSMSGATVTTLTRLGLLVSTGRYERCATSSSRNSNKLQPVYVLDVGALRALTARHAGDAMRPGTA